MAYDSRQIQDAKSHIDLVAFVRAETRLAYKRVASTGGGEYAGPCPFCGGTDRFRMQLNHRGKGPKWFCRQCGDQYWYDIIDFVEKYHELDYRQAVAYLGLVDDCKPQVTLKKIEPQVVKPPEPIPSDLHVKTHQDCVINSIAMDWWANQGMTAPVVDAWFLGYQNYYGSSAGTIPVVYPNKGLMGMKYRLWGKQQNKYRSWPGQGNLLFNAKALTMNLPYCNLANFPNGDGQLPYVLIAEGEKKAIILSELKFPAISATTGAGNFQEEWFRYLRKHVIIVADPDEVGQRAAWDLARDIFHWRLANKQYVDLQSAGVFVVHEVPYKIDDAIYQYQYTADDVAYWLNGASAIQLDRIQCLERLNSR